MKFKGYRVVIELFASTSAHRGNIHLSFSNKSQVNLGWVDSIVAMVKMLERCSQRGLHRKWVPPGGGLSLR